jgi:hypothetical protein
MVPSGIREFSNEDMTIFVSLDVRLSSLVPKGLDCRRADFFHGGVARTQSTVST